MRKFATGAFSFACGAFAAAYILPLDWLLIAAVALAVLGCIAMAFTFKWKVRVVTILLSAALGLCWSRGYYQLFFAPADQLDGETMKISATVTDFSITTDFGYRISVKAAIDGRHYNSYLYYEDPDLDLQPGDTISTTARLKRAKSSAVDDELMYTAQDIALMAFLDNGSSVNVYRPETTPLRYLPLYAAKWLGRTMEELFNSQMAPFVKALVLGDRSEIDDSFLLDISRSGMKHIFVVSGMHVGFLISLLMLLIPQRNLAASISIPLVLVFAVMVGLTPSVIRASMMYLLSLIAPFIKREKDDITTLSFSLLILLLADPYAIADPSLQLSFASAASMSIFAPAIQRRFQSSFPKFTGNFIGKFITASISSSLGTMVLTIPIVCLIYHSVCIVAPLSNLLTLWAFEICFIMGISAPLVSLISLPVAQAMATVCYPLFLYIRLVLKVLADIPFACMSTDETMFVVWLIYIYALAGLSIVFKNRRPWVQTCCSISLLGVIIVTTWRYESTSSMTFAALDVGQGQCLAVTSMGHTVVIDCGGTSEPANTLLTYLGDIQQTTIDAVILTHYHDDHAEYVPQVLETIPTTMVILPDIEDDTGNRSDITSSAQKSGTEVCFIETDSTLNFGCCTVDIFAPMSIGEQNERCLSMVISCEDYDILVTGDMSTQQEGWLADTRNLPDCEVLVCGHHGSKYATSDYFLETTTPETAVISVGYNNYGHPAEDTLQRLDRHKVEIMRTDESGNIILRYREEEDDNG